MKVGIIGAGTIVPGFLEAAKKVNDFDITSIAAPPRNQPRMEELAKIYGIQFIYTDTLALLQSDVDVVYVAVPNHLHFEVAKQAMEYGKHVILEKPFASSYAQAEALIQISQKHGVFIFEAIVNQYLPNYQKTKECLPMLGDIKIVQLNYSQYSRRYDAFKQGEILPVFDVHKAGGALMDINIYNIHFLVGLFGKPTKVHYFANIECGVDTSGILTLTYPTFQCVAVGAKDCQAPLSVNIQGDLGFIHSDASANSYPIFQVGPNQGERETFALNHEQRMYYELQVFTDALRKNDKKAFETYNQHTLMVMEIVDDARKQVGIPF